MTTIYLVRHAIAEARGPEYPDDTKRPLTRKGKDRMRRAVAGFRTLEPGIELVVSSPLVRAKQTATILLEGLAGSPRLEQIKALAPDHSPQDVATALRKLKVDGAIALVGHEPDLGALAAWLIGSPRPIPMKKGGIARIDVPKLPPDQNGTLVWLATPAILRSL
jgi:phosphohistidine phosphatase